MPICITATSFICFYFFKLSRVAVIYQILPGYMLYAIYTLLLGVYMLILTRKTPLAASVISFLVFLISPPCLFYLLYGYSWKETVLPILRLGNLLMILLATMPWLWLAARKSIRKIREKQLSVFDSGQKLSFLLLEGIEGIDVFKPNYQTKVELLQTEIRLSEIGTGKYSTNLKSVLLPYSQITDADIVRLEDGKNIILHSKMLSTSSVHKTKAQYCLISYRSKDGESKQLRFKITLGFGDFNLFMQALKSRITTQPPTNYEL